MIDVEIKHDIDLKKGVGLAVMLGVAIGVTTTVTKECIEYGKNKIKKKKNNV